MARPQAELLREPLAALVTLAALVAAPMHRSEQKCRLVVSVCRTYGGSRRVVK